MQFHDQACSDMGNEERSLFYTFEDSAAVM